MPLFPTSVSLREFLLAGGAFLIGPILAVVFYFFMARYLERLVSFTKTNLDGMLLSALRLPIGLGFVLGGSYLAARVLPGSSEVDRLAAKAVSVALALLGVFAVTMLLNALVKWYGMEIAPRTEGGLDDKVATFLRLAVPALAIILGVILGLEMVGVHLGPVTGWLAQHGVRILIIVAITIAGLLIVSQALPRAIQTAVVKGMPEESPEERRKRARTLASVFVTAGQVAVAGGAFFMLLDEVGISIAPLLAGVGVAGIAIGFGAQNLVRDILQGMFIIMENQYRVGDVVKVADVSGLVEQITLRKTVLRDLDGIVHHIPNGEIRVASNFTKEWSRVNLNVSVGYGEDLDRCIAVINRVGQELAQDPQWKDSIIKAPQVLRVDNLGDSGIELKILGDTQPIRQWDVMGELRKRIKKAFDEAGIEIPWPHTKVYFGNWPGEARVSPEAAPERKP